MCWMFALTPGLKQGFPRFFVTHFASHTKKKELEKLTSSTKRSSSTSILLFEQIVNLSGCLYHCQSSYQDLFVFYNI